MRKLWLAILVTGFLAGAVTSQDEVKKKGKLQGTWKVLSIEKEGKAKDFKEDHWLIFTGQDFSIKKGDEAIIKGTFKIDRSKKPRTIDMKITEDKEEKNKGKTALGIINLKGDTLKLCVAEPGSTERPEEFSAKEGAKQILITLKREKE